MDNNWLVLILIGLSASFMPLQFGVEIYLLGGDDGLKKTSGLVGGITLFRVLSAAVTALLFAGALAALRQRISGLAHFIESVLLRFGQDINSGQDLLLDVLLVITGVLLLIYTYRDFRGRSAVNHSTDKIISKIQGFSAGKILVFGLTWTAVSLNQWIFTTAGVSQVLRMPIHPLGGLLAFGLYLLVASLMIVLPIVVFVIRPRQARAILEKMNQWLNGALGYVILTGLFVIGLYLIWHGIEGVRPLLTVWDWIG